MIRSSLGHRVTPDISTFMRRSYKTAAATVVPDAVTVMDPFHVVALAGTKLDLVRQRIQQQTLGRRGHTGDPLYGIRRIARTRLQLLSTRQYARLTGVFDTDEHLAVKVAWLIYQKIIAAYADPNRPRGKEAMTRLIASIRRGVPAGLEEIAQLGRTLSRRRDDILAFFDHRTSNGPTEAINGAPGSLAPQRPRIPQPHPLPNPLTPTQRRTPPTRQCTLNYEEPPKRPYPRPNPQVSAICQKLLAGNVLTQVGCRAPMLRIISVVSGCSTNGSLFLRVGLRIRCQTLPSISWLCYGSTAICTNRRLKQWTRFITRFPMAAS